ncbi:Tmem173 [Amphibalanus amphitrite]|uniref:Tmem173 n=1 Tax=Amphibalanus amphitrite TaxID=1232801 RepID=A0A6A4WTS3_AMPAM|nr:stimulator of interferon genes protein-like isoform X1 [Amphibalanus amphitrite]KAF0307030.1 Tmem173 [Amphibalanus amphitrite]
MEQWLSYWPTAVVAVVGVAYAALSEFVTVADVAILVLGYCLSPVCAARLLQSAYLQRRQGPRDGARAATEGAGCTYWAALLLIGFAAVTSLVVLFGSPRTDFLDGLKELLLLVFTVTAISVPLAAALEISNTSKPELADALSEKQISFSEGAAWIFFLGYLEIIFGESGKPFAARMDDYLCHNLIREEDRGNACREKMIIIIPMTHKALLNDRWSDVPGVQRDSEKPLAEAARVGVRKFGQVHVYQVKDGAHMYRVAMEPATPLRSIGQAAEDRSCENFDCADYEAFAERFLLTLNEILKNKPVIGNQVELVPIKDFKELGSAVAEHVRELMAARQTDDECPGTPEPAPGSLEPAPGSLEPAPGSLEPAPEPSEAARQPEESSEMDSDSWR